MGFSVNLRGDLAKLSDVELTERLDAACQTYDAAKKPWLRWGPLWRGPVRHPRPYRFLMALGNATGGGWLDLVFAAVFSGKKTERLLRNDPAIDVHLTVCEIRDLTEEMERRVTHRRAAKKAMQ
jgi:hypothetical protein